MLKKSRSDTPTRPFSFEDETTVDVDLNEKTAIDVTATVEESSFRDVLPAKPTGNLGVADVILIAHPDDTGLGTRFRLPPQGELVIGRHLDASISLPEVRSLSRHHARLRYCGDRVEVQDLGSTNGTFVNDRLVESAETLHSGDRFQVGAAHFKFLHERDPEHAYHEAIHNLVVRDGLTEAFNRRKFEEEMAREFARASRHRRPLTLVLFDIDHFKDVNDTHGHLCGDFILQQIVQQTRRFLRTEQMLARVGGEEFAIAGPEIGLTGAVKLAERLRKFVAESEFEFGEASVRITCSFGVAQLVPTMKGPEDLFEAADQAMYQSKERGRNLVSCHVPDL